MFWMRRHCPDSLNLSCNYYIPCWGECCAAGIKASGALREPFLHHQPPGCTSLISPLLVHTSSFGHTNPVSPPHPLQASVSAVSFPWPENLPPPPPSFSFCSRSPAAITSQVFNASFYPVLFSFVTAPSAQHCFGCLVDHGKYHLN